MESSVVGTLILLVLRGVAWTYAWMPASGRRAWAVGLGWVLRRLKLRARVVHENLMIAFPNDERMRARIFEESYVSLASLSLEILMLFGPMRSWVLRNVEVSGLEHWKEARQQGKGVLFLANHVGNWEVMSAAGAALCGMDLMLVTKHLKPEWLHQAIQNGRLKCGVRATYEPRTLKDVLSWLKKGGTVGFVLDQYTGPPVGVRVPLFGVPVGTSMAVATLAKRTGAAVLPVVNYRAPGGKYRVEIRAPLTWQAGEGAEELAKNTARYAAEVEQDILAHPEQWLWIHRRFKGDLSPLRDGEWAEGRARQ